MSSAQWMQLFSSGVLAVSIAYLITRTIQQVRVQRRSYRDLPFAGPPGPLAKGDHAADKTLDRACAAMLGLAVGDALGMPRESLPVWLANLRFGRTPSFSHGIVRFMRRRGTVSDDTQLTVATARAISDDGQYDNAHFTQNLCHWIGRAIGPGRATLRAARGWRAGRDQRDTDSEGNGAAMRVLALAITYRRDPERLIDAVRINAETTHPNAEAVAGAEVMAKLFAWLLSQKMGANIDYKVFVAAIMPLAISQDSRDWEQRMHRAALGADGGHTLAEVGVTGWVKHTVPAVIFMLATHGDDTHSALAELWALGGDIDTIAALYLACIGALCGSSVLDTDLVESVQGCATLVAEATRLHTIETILAAQ